MGRSAVVEKVRALDLADDSYIVIGSGVMDALGLRASEDIDVVVSEPVFEELRAAGWETSAQYGDQCLVRGDFEAWKTWSYQGEQTSLAELQKDRVIIDGIPFVSPQYLLKWKQDKDRPKDIRDIELLQEYLRERI